MPMWGHIRGYRRRQLRCRFNLCMHAHLVVHIGKFQGGIRWTLEHSTPTGSNLLHWMDSFCQKGMMESSQSNHSTSTCKQGSDVCWSWSVKCKWGTKKIVINGEYFCEHISSHHTKGIWCQCARTLEIFGYVCAWNCFAQRFCMLHVNNLSELNFCMVVKILVMQTHQFEQS